MAFPVLKYHSLFVLIKYNNKVISNISGHILPVCYVVVESEKVGRDGWIVFVVGIGHTVSWSWIGVG